MEDEDRCFALPTCWEGGQGQSQTDRLPDTCRLSAVSEPGLKLTVLEIHGPSVHV